MNNKSQIENWEEELKGITGMLAFTNLVKGSTREEIMIVLENLNKYLSGFISNLLSQEKENRQKELTIKIQKLKGIDKSVLEEILNLLKEK